MDNFLYGKNKGWNSVKNLLNYQKNNAKLINNNKPSYDIDKAAEQLLRDAYNQEWTKKHTNSEPLTITYTFPDSTELREKDYSNLYYYSHYPAPEGLNAYQQQQAKLALQAWEDVANIKLVKVDSAEKAMITFGNYHGASNSGVTIYGPMYFSGNSFFNSDINNKIWLNTDLNDNKLPTLGNHGRHTYIHELGHALGLSHPGTYNSMNGGYEYNARYQEDSLQYSVMSYWDETKTGANYNYIETDNQYIYNKTYYSAAPLMHDIAAIQKIHGANTSTRTGHDIYGFNSNTDRDFYTLTDSNQKAVFCVWDGGGIDTLDFSKYSQNQRINLNEGSFSDVGGLKANVSIAQHTTIENAIGGLGNDVIVGNDANNTLEGGKGDDIIYGGKGRDILWGGNRNDVVPNTKTVDLPAIEVEETVLYNGDDTQHNGDDDAQHNGDDDEQPVEDYCDNEVTNPCWTTSPWGGYNGNSNCPWTNPSCNNNGYLSSYYSAPMFNGFTYSYNSPWQYYGNNMFYNAAYSYQQGYCNNNNYGYCKQSTSTNQIIDNNTGDNNSSYYYNEQKAQKMGNGSGKDTFVFASIEDSPFDNPDIIMDFETGIDKIDLSAIILLNSDHYRIAPHFIDHLPQKTGEMQLTYDSQLKISHLYLNADNDDIPDFALDIYGVVKESDFMLA
ncbi:M10 family metallopeptidase C-terminal domain-containing protein [Arsenophonus sp. aPb]|uniref:M10 family metallopeptidase C-terminal domain-containing protein n=1 Tax=Arsenophonus sp. aPb TaxID=3041619 RepID=UPI00246857A2|nr:M10 family metallopeptidase C-terminal domain-containing protein [Arsenophonus sp. aPb]WGL98672.1 M10 family metallopeptidase C-terminal domain-containing protein [Arsenophonus sp. aPb]